MRFRPCIDIHNGRVKQIVGGSLTDSGDRAEENYVSGEGAAAFAESYKKYNLSGGHVIMLNSRDSPYYEATRREALCALSAWPGNLQIGGGITDENAGEFLAAGASHVIVTSFVFRDGRIEWDRLRRLCGITGRERLVLDLSCRRKENDYYIVTDRWQSFTGERLSEDLLRELADYADEFLVHAVDVEGRMSGIEEEVVRLLGRYSPIPATYAGGISGLHDIDIIEELGEGRVDFTVGSALDIFGGKLSFEEVVKRGIT